MTPPLTSLVLAVSLAVAPVPSVDTYPRQPGVDVQHYSFALTLSDSTDEIVGDATVSIRFTKDGLTAFFLDFATPAAGKGMTVTAVDGDSSALQSSQRSAGARSRMSPRRPGRRAAVLMRAPMGSQYAVRRSPRGAEAVRSGSPNRCRRLRAGCHTEFRTRRRRAPHRRVTRPPCCPRTPGNSPRTHRTHRLHGR